MCWRFPSTVFTGGKLCQCLSSLKNVLVHLKAVLASFERKMSKPGRHMNGSISISILYIMILNRHEKQQNHHRWHHRSRHQGVTAKICCLICHTLPRSKCGSHKHDSVCCGDGTKTIIGLFLQLTMATNLKKSVNI